MKRSIRIDVAGIVQGVGFRPFVVHLADRWHIAGTILNDGRGVTIAAEGEEAAVERFLSGLRSDAPPLARIETLQVVERPVVGYAGFAILESVGDGVKSAAVAPDAHLCDDCLREMCDPTDRRYRYPFINCTNCGPRFSLITGIPYDRPRTTMADFPMCDDCRREYSDPASRRYHAQPIACPACGPALRLLDRDGAPLPGDPLSGTIAALRRGEIVAIKGLGGFHLAVDPANDAAVRRLRQRKQRDEKPFALMVPTLAAAQRLALLERDEERLLCGVERPIVLLQQRAGHGLSPQVAPGNRYLGIMLAYTPLHQLLLREGGFSALVMTSGNRSDEPIAYRDDEALESLRELADLFLLHNRRIHIRIDDSIVRLMCGRPLVLRRARGYVPRPLRLPEESPEVVALGADLKNTLCFLREQDAVLSQHLGDLSNAESCAAHGAMLDHFRTVLALTPAIVAHDLHPDYQSTRRAEELPGVRRVPVQHHHAHLVSCLAENGRLGPALGVIFDGTGYGADGSIWGGEFLLGDAAGFRRLGHWEGVALPGGDAAIREPWRPALALLRRLYGDDLPELPFLAGITAQECRIVTTMLERGLNTPTSTGCGRLFDVAAALIGVRSRVSYEGQAALELEMCADASTHPPYPHALLRRGETYVVDHAPLFRALVADLVAGTPRGVVSRRFHAGVAAATGALCGVLRRETGQATVALSGGVFQNRLLTETLVAALQGDGFEVLTHSLVPPNDGGISLGQAVIAGYSRRGTIEL